MTPRGLVCFCGRASSRDRYRSLSKGGGSEKVASRTTALLESIHARLKDELFNRDVSGDVRKDQPLAAICWKEANRRRPQSSLN